ncbi:BglG family transcription antiterminator [Paraliobacillus sediminis]|uniref:BglG family transcription antiterminator n=1 Tax=Paraliobacillus sediminis TaxID=1885916 RepID=UPI000E3CA317|nr:BglG family transcription antiterminator [Paraliobacillus sediminis]
MNSRIIQILRELMASEEAVTSEYLANIINVTSRTVRDDIKALGRLLDSNGAKINSIRGSGYVLHIEDDQRFRSYLQQFLDEEKGEDTVIPDSPDERIKYLIRRFLLAEGYLKLDELCEEMHISKSTIQNDVRQVKKVLENYAIHLDKRPSYGMKVIGSEVKLRFAMSEYVFDRSANVAKSIWQDQLSSITDQKNLDAIWSVIMNQIKENGITLSDIAINNLFIHIAIAYKRIKSGHHVSLFKKELNEIIDQKEYEVAKKIVVKTEELLGVTFPQEEIAYIAIHLLGTKMISQTNMSEQEIGLVMEDNIYRMTMLVLNSIESKLHLGIRHDRELIIGLGLHLKPAINRYKYGMNVRNPMIDDIKTNYPLAFEAGIVAGMVLEEEMEVSIDENEIGYIALHIGAAIERSKLQTGPKRCIIVCASGLGSAQLLKYKLKSKFGSKLDVIGTTEFYKLQQIPFEEIDFIVSSVPITEKVSVPVIEVNTILGDKDLDKIEAFVIDNTSSVFEYIKQDLLFLHQSFQTKDEVLHFLVDVLEDKKLIPDNYLNLIYEREKVAPTAYGNLVAIPHPITAQTNSTFLTICTLEKPIDWADKRVQFICLLNVEKDSQKDLQNMYEMLGKIVDNAHLIQQLNKCENYQEFIRALIK